MVHDLHSGVALSRLRRVRALAGAGLWSIRSVPVRAGVARHGVRVVFSLVGTNHYILIVLGPRFSGSWHIARRGVVVVVGAGRGLVTCRGAGVGAGFSRRGVVTTRGVVVGAGVGWGVVVSASGAVRGQVGGRRGGIIVVAIVAARRRLILTSVTTLVLGLTIRSHVVVTGRGRIVRGWLGIVNPGVLAVFRGILIHFHGDIMGAEPRAARVGPVRCLLGRHGALDQGSDRVL
mmetsp:Transcript_17188/g.37857  ORF Transcript_17188/g.37857 Transcript_17188/m.37857 type:complete len:233 (+) Transcript_17188:171-869(+)